MVLMLIAVVGCSSVPVGLARNRMWFRQRFRLARIMSRAGIAQVLLAQSRLSCKTLVMKCAGNLIGNQLATIPMHKMQTGMYSQAAAIFVVSNSFH